MSLEEAQTLIMSARIQLGMVDPAGLEAPEAEAEDGGEAVVDGGAPEGEARA